MHRCVRLGTLLGILGILALGLARCVPAAQPSPAERPGPPPPGAAAPAPKAKYGGILTYAVNEDPIDLDLHLDGTHGIAGTIPYSKLVKLDNNGRILPDLAESWDVSADGRTYTFHLRKGVKFQNRPPANSREMTADDVIYSLKRIGTKGPEWQKNFLVDEITQYEAPDKNTVKLTTREPFGPQLTNLADDSAAVVPRELVEQEGDLRKKALGTGPWILEGYQTKINYTLKKNPDYFLKDLPYMDGIEVLVVPDKATRIAALRAGKVDVLRMGYTVNDVDTVQRTNPDIQVMPGWVGAFSVAFNLTKAPFNDVRVRRAMSMVIDREGLGKVMEGGRSIPSGYIQPYHVDFALPQEELLKLPGYKKPKDQDIAEAKQLMAQAGYDKGFKMEIIGTSNLHPHAPVLANEWAKLGIDASLKALAQTETFDLRNRGLFDTYLDRYRIFPDIDETLYPTYSIDGNRNFGKYVNPKVDELVKKQRYAVDRGERIKIVREIQRILHEDVPLIIIYQIPEFVMLQPYVRDYEKNMGIPFNRFEHYLSEVWLDK